MLSLDCLQYLKQCINSYDSILFRDNDEKCLHILNAWIFLVFINTTDLSITESAELESVEAQMSLGMPLLQGKLFLF